jgi:tetraacyldisaccharide 4'-kinase
VSIFGTIYGTAVYARNTLYDRGTFKSRRLLGPVVSIGNISTGGAGKTPFTILLGSLLEAKGIKFDVLSRGYGRKTSGVLLVDPQGPSEKFGDEPILIAQKLQVPVIVGESRYKAGLFAEQKFGPRLHILDDGFQHRALTRDFEIALLSASDLKDRLLPTGHLREPLSSLKRADVVVVSEELHSDLLLSLNKPLWDLQRGISVENPPSRPIVFCGIARPNIFLSQLHSAGIEPAGKAIFRDHHRYNASDVRTLQKLRDERHADGFITTEKDSINLGEHTNLLQPITIAKVTLEMEDSANALDTMLRTISAQSAEHEKILLNS